MTRVTAPHLCVFSGLHFSSPEVPCLLMCGCFSATLGVTRNKIQVTSHSMVPSSLSLLIFIVSGALLLWLHLSLEHFFSPGSFPSPISYEFSISEKETPTVSLPPISPLPSSRYTEEICILSPCLIFNPFQLSFLLYFETTHVLQSDGHFPI